MILNKRILLAINEGVTNALLLDDTDVETINRKSSELIKSDIKYNTEKTLYSRKLQEMLPDPMKINGKFIDQALEWYNKYGATYEVLLGKVQLSHFITKCINCLGDNANLNWINTSKITDMSQIFMYSYFNGDISEWDVSNVTNMYSMFTGSSFNGDISLWNVSNVENMELMFRDCKKFNCDISSWNVSNVENMWGIFMNCLTFKLDISMWNVSNVKRYGWAFSNCKIKDEYKPNFK